MDQSSYLSQVLWQYRVSSQFTDVTLVCADDQLSAHAALLSGFFSSLGLGSLEEPPDVLLLPDIGSRELEAALKTLYKENSTKCLLEMFKKRDISNSMVGDVKLEVTEEVAESKVYANEDTFDVKTDITDVDDYDDNLEEKVEYKSDLEEDSNRVESSTEEKPSRPKKSQTDDDYLEIEPSQKFNWKKRKQNPKAITKNKKQKGVKVINNKDGDLCPYCSKPLSARSLTKHLIIKHRQEVLSFHPELVEQFEAQCSECEEMFMWKTQDLYNHMKKVHGSVNNIPCPYCDKMSNSNNFNNHIFYVHKEKRHLHPEIEPKVNCDECGEKFLARNQLNNHMKHMHTGSATCEVCSKVCPNERSLEMHVYGAHRTEKKCICEFCNQAFNNNSTLKIHKQHVHLGGRKFKFKCTLCMAGKYQTEEKLQQHMLDCHSGIEYKCDLCPVTCHTKQLRDDHWNRAHGEKNFKCEHCDMRFYAKGLMRLHMSNIHLKDKKKTCPICGEVFGTDHNTYVAHMNRHNNIRPYPCEVCAKGFLTPKALKTHMNSHTRPYKCDQCALGFASKDEVDKHVDRVHLGIQQECRHGCGFQTSLLSNRSRHEKQCSSNPIPGAPWAISNGTANRYVLETYNASKK